MSLTVEELETLGKSLLAQLLPTIEAAAKSAVASASPVAALLVTPLIDEVDAYVSGLLGAPVAPTAPTDVASQIVSLQKHVAALTVATGHGTSQAMVTAKVATAALPAAAQPS
jgi:uncharacterized membrane protein